MADYIVSVVPEVDASLLTMDVQRATSSWRASSLARIEHCLTEDGHSYENRGFPSGKNGFERNLSVGLAMCLGDHSNVVLAQFSPLASIGCAIPISLNQVVSSSFFLFFQTFVSAAQLHAAPPC